MEFSQKVNELADTGLSQETFQIMMTRSGEVSSKIIEIGGDVNGALRYCKLYQKLFIKSCKEHSEAYTIDHLTSDNFFLTTVSLSEEREGK